MGDAVFFEEGSPAAATERVVLEHLGHQGFPGFSGRNRVWEKGIEHQLPDDAAALAKSVIDGGCDSVLLMSYATDGGAITEALVSQGFSGHIIGADGVADAAFTESFADASAVDGVVATRPRPGEESTAKATFEAAYSAAGGSDGAIYTNETYDAIKIIAAAIMSDPDGDIVAAISKTGNNYDGASGVHTFDAAGDVLGTGYEVCQFDGTAFSCPRIWTADGGLAAK